jgi:DNA topoisomerase-1
MNSMATKSKKKKDTKAAHKVVIVESPTKAKTIKSFLGHEYTLISSQGHIKDLPRSRLGVDVDNNFAPEYIKIRGKAKIIKEIIKACKKSTLIFLAPDPDREGEAIAQHLAEALDSSVVPIKRALFYEITPEYVKRALQHPGSINTNLVSAHKARRVLDRIVGYYTSPILWSIIKGGLSAGRVQSVALRLVCEREAEITSFRSTPYWNATAEFETAQKELFQGVLCRIDNVFRKIKTKEELSRLKGFLRAGAEFAVTSYRVTNPQRVSPPPFITSTLQQEAARKHNFPAKKTMQVAQSLYEGVKLPQGRIGLITYMRTDSIRVNAGAIEELRTYIASKYGNDYLHKEIRKFKDRKAAQAGHEAIRPTKIRLEPDLIKEHLTPEQYKIYKLIFERFVASQMSAARYQQKEAIVSFMGVDFRSEEMKPIFLGYQLVRGDVVERGSVPKLEVGETVYMRAIEFEEKQTEPPPRYTEASLIKKLEENGIGRPSTYAHILQTLFDRRYAVKGNGKVAPTELGQQVYDIIIPRFSNIFEVSFTAKMEKELDHIETGRKIWQDVVREFYEPFVVTLNKTKKEVETLKEAITEKVDKNCPKCQRPLVVKWGRYGKFLACSGFPECKYSENLEVEESEKKCPKCGRALIVRQGRYGKFLACPGYPECRYTENLSHDVPCPLCGKEVIIITTRRGKIYKCKHCDFSSFYPPLDEKCPKCGRGMVAKRNKQMCPVCDTKKKK